jgi:hypothetical protein
MFYRRKIMLALLEKCGGTLGRLRLQKLLFLIAHHQGKPCFDFVPYKFGAYSFRANADAGTMCKYGLISTDDQKVWKKETEELFYPALKKKDQQIIDTVLYRFGALTGRELIEYTYRRYPYYAINSLVAKRYLEPEDLEQIEAKRPTEDEACLMTIGYEGISAEAYFNQLLTHNVSALIDVRRNAASMKYGFHKSQLAHVCRSVGIAYYHVPEVGISNDKRRSLKTQEDYDVLFEEYRDGTLQTEINGQRSIIDLYKKHGRIALTCFEALSCQCHRSHLADNLHKIAPEEVSLPVHI